MFSRFCVRHVLCLHAGEMNPQAEQLKKRTKKFAVDVLLFVRCLVRSDEAKIIGGQLIRAATGVASNYRATCRSRSDGEFIARVGIALEEADESALWLEIIIELELSRSKEAFRLLDEADQLSAILAQSRITATQNVERPKTGARPRRPSRMESVKHV